jgi:hypothetical protein
LVETCGDRSVQHYHKPEFIEGLCGVHDALLWVNKKKKKNPTGQVLWSTPSTTPYGGVGRDRVLDVVEFFSSRGQSAKERVQSEKRGRISVFKLM